VTGPQHGSARAAAESNNKTSKADLAAFAETLPRALADAT
jgi:hypothetical protein